MGISTIRNKENFLPTIVIYFFGILGVMLVVFFGGELIKNIGKIRGSSGLTIEVLNGEAQVIINDQIVGKTPYESNSVKPGSNTITIKTDTQQYKTSIKFLPASKEMVYAVGIIRDLGVSDVFSSGQEFWFDQENTEETLKIVSDPSEASVYIDGNLVGKTPYSASNVSSGDYEIKIDLPGYEPQTARISVQKGYTLNGSLKLFPLPIQSDTKEFEGSPNLYNVTLSNEMVTSDTQTWVKALIYWNSTRGISIGDTGSNTEKVFDYYLDYKGNVFDSDGNILISTQDIQKLAGSKKGAYLGRISDGEGLTKEARDSLDTLSSIGISGKTVTIKNTPTGWLRVRSTPSLSGQEISRVDSGKSYSVLETATGWVKIQASESIQGWVSADYVNLSE